MNVRSIRRIAVDTVGILLLPEVEDLLELLHEQGVIPVLWHLPFYSLSAWAYWRNSYFARERFPWNRLSPSRNAIPG